MHVPILGTTHLTEMEVPDKMLLVDQVFQELRSKRDPILFAGIEGNVAITVADRRYIVQIDDGRLQLIDASDLTGAPIKNVLASVTTGTDEFLARTVICAGYATADRRYTPIRVSGDAGVANALLSVLGMLPDRIARALHGLEARSYERCVDELLYPSLAHLEEKRPFVIRGGAKNWPAARWTLDGLANKLPDGELRQRLYAIASGARTPRYLSAWIEDVVLPDLRFEAVGPFRFEPGETFVSTKGALAMLHRDFVDGIAAVFFGPRRFTFFPPSDARYLYPLPGKEWDAQTCHVRDPRGFDPVAFPLAKQASPVHVTIKPTDLVYIPAGWFHSVVSQEVSIIIKASADLEISWPASDRALVSSPSRT